jgi:hypothetical protein
MGIGFNHSVYCRQVKNHSDVGFEVLSGGYEEFCLLLYDSSLAVLSNYRIFL